jgi:hypothetical protein
VQMRDPSGLIEQVKPGDPIIIFHVTERNGEPTIHVADRWLLAAAVPDRDPPLWRTTGEYNIRRSFPGRTDSLVRLMQAIQEGKPGILNAVEDKVLLAAPRRLAQLPPGVLAEISRTPKPLRYPQEGGPALADTDGRFEEGGRQAVMVLRLDGITRYSLSDPPRASDFTRLTGESWSSFFKEDAKITAATATAIDINGDGLDDYLVLTDTGGVLLINRGFGAFLASAEAPKALHKAGIKPPSRLFASDVDGDRCADLVVISPDGAIQVVPNRAK